MRGTRKIIIISICYVQAYGYEDDTVPKPRPNDKGAAPRFAMASPSIWCRISLWAAIFSPPLCLSHPLPPYVLPFPTLGIGMMFFLIKTNLETTDFTVPPSFLLNLRAHSTIRYLLKYTLTDN